MPAFQGFLILNNWSEITNKGAFSKVTCKNQIKSVSNDS